MSAVSSWLLSIACVVILSVLAEFVLPEGQINKYTKVIFSFVIMLVIIMPLPKLFGKDINFSELLGHYDSNLQEDYLFQLNIDKITALTDELSEKIENEGLRNVRVRINASVLTKELEIYGIFVDLCDIEYDKKFGSKDIVKAKLRICELASEFDILKDIKVEFLE